MLKFENECFFNLSNSSKHEGPQEALVTTDDSVSSYPGHSGMDSCDHCQPLGDFEAAVVPCEPYFLIPISLINSQLGVEVLFVVYEYWYSHHGEGSSSIPHGYIV